MFREVVLLVGEAPDVVDVGAFAWKCMIDE
jgi:hypothetical protein